jgi:hypothetical protein
MSADQFFSANHMAWGCGLGSVRKRHSVIVGLGGKKAAHQSLFNTGDAKGAAQQRIVPIPLIYDEFDSWRTFDGNSRIKADDIIEEVASFIDRAMKNPTAIRAFLAAMSGALYNSKLADVAAKVNADTVAKFEGAFRNGIEHGEINPMIDPHRTAIMLIGTVRGIIMQWLLNPKKTELEALAKQLLTLMRHHYTLHKASMTRDHWYFSTCCQKRSATWRLATSLALVCW